MKAKVGTVLLTVMFVAIPVLFGGVGEITAAEKILKIGGSLPLSGPAAEWGLVGKRMMGFFAEDVNAKGGLKIGNDIYKIQVICYDDKAQPSEAASNTTKLVHDDKIQYFIGGVVGSLGMAVLPITQPAKVITTSFWFGKEILGPDKPFSFRQSASHNEMTPAMYKWTGKNNPTIKTVAQINPNDTPGWEVAAGIEEAAKANGMKLIAGEFFERGTKDMYPILTRILAKKPDLIDLGGTTPGDGAVIIKQLYELGYRGAKLWTSGTALARTIQLCGPESMEGLGSAYCLNIEGPNSTAETKAMVLRYRREFNEPCVDSYITSYAMLQIFTQTMVKLGTTNPEAVVADLEKTHKFDTVLGTFLLLGKNRYGIDRQFVHPMMFGQIRGGKIVELEWLSFEGL
jgi:branched-chain amino acid transport system substrate-binding protein